MYSYIFARARSSGRIDRIAIARDTAVVPQLSMKTGRAFAITAAVAWLVRLSTRYAWFLIVGSSLLAIISATYVVRHFAITTDSNKLLSSSLPWRQQEIMLDLAFPHRIDQIVAVIDATTPEAADHAADALANELASRPDVIRTV